MANARRTDPTMLTLPEELDPIDTTIVLSVPACRAWHSP
jgi:hypothetical protein